MSLPPESIINWLHVKSQSLVNIYPHGPHLLSSYGSPSQHLFVAIAWILSVSRWIIILGVHICCQSPTTDTISNVVLLFKLTRFVLKCIRSWIVPSLFVWCSASLLSFCPNSLAVKYVAAHWHAIIGNNIVGINQCWTYGDCRSWLLAGRK